MKAMSLIIGAMVVMLLFGAVLGAVNATRMVDFQEQHDITTAAAETTADVVLSQDLYGDKTSNVNVTSDLSTDAPIAFTYVSDTQTLTINGLDDDATRRLTLTYKIDNLDDFLGLGIAIKVWPTFLILGVIGIIVAAVYTGTRRGE